MHLKTLRPSLALAALLLAGCSIRSISNSSYEAAYGRGGSVLGFVGELSELDVLGLSLKEPTTDAKIQSALAHQEAVRLARDSRVLLIQSGADYPDAPMLDALRGRFSVDTFSGRPTHGIAGDGDFSRALRLAAARGGFDKIVCYWGVLESERKKKVTAAVSWVPIVGHVLPDEREHMRLRLKAAVVDVATGRWTLLTPPAEMGADIAVGSAQRFGVPMGFGGPHAAFFATRDEYKRSMPGRLVGVSKDSSGKPALRLALQTREQHIRREKATSNICTAQVLLAVMASMYGVYHGPKGVRAIAERVSRFATAFAALAKKAGFTIVNDTRFDTVTLDVGSRRAQAIASQAEKHGALVRVVTDSRIAVSFDEAKGSGDLTELCVALGIRVMRSEVEKEIAATAADVPAALARPVDYLSHPVFNSHHSETEFLRYVRKLESRDLSLGFSMIPLGSCTMKLNARSEEHTSELQSH